MNYYSKNNRKEIVLVALLVAIIGMSLGFSAFSSTLSISSSASVTPNSEDFNIKLYGFKDIESWNAFGAAGKVFNASYVDSTSALGLGSDSNITFERLELDNNTYSLKTSDIRILGKVTSVTYHVLIRNEGQYDAYINTQEFVSNSGTLFYSTTGTCTPDVGTTESLLDAACDSVVLQVILSPVGNCEINTSENYYKIPKGEYGVLSVVVGTRETSNYADGPFTVNFPDFKLNVSTSI